MIFMIKIVLIGHGFSLVDLSDGVDLSDTCFYAEDGEMVNGGEVPNIFEGILNDDRTTFNHNISHDFLLSSECDILNKDNRPSCIKDLNPQNSKFIICGMFFYMFNTIDSNNNQVVILIPATYNVGVKLSWIKKHTSVILNTLKLNNDNEIVYHWVACMSEVNGTSNEDILKECNKGNLTKVNSIFG